MPISTAPRPWACHCSPAKRKGGWKRCCATRAAGALKPLYNYHGRPAGHRGHADPADGGRARAAHRRRHDLLRRRPRLSLPMLVLHHHQRAGAQVAPALAGRRRKDRAGELRAGPARLFHHRRQFRPQQRLGADPRPAHLSARGREVQHQLHHPGRHALPQAAEFHREMRARRRQARVHRAGEHQSGQSGWRQEAAEQDHRIPARCCWPGRTPASSLMPATSSASRTTRSS